MTETVPDAGYRAKVTRNWIVPQGADTVNGFLVSHDIYGDLLADGWTARAQMREDYGTAVLVEFTSDAVSGPRIEFADDVTVTDTNGVPHTGSTVTIVLDAATTEDTAWNTVDGGGYDLELISPTGVVTRYAEGTFEVDHDITRDDA